MVQDKKKTSKHEVINPQGLQAQFLIPIAASLGFGILFATVIILLIVPALVAMKAKVKSYFERSTPTYIESSLGAEVTTA